LSDRPTRPVLPDVTLVAVTSVALPATLDALHASMRQAQFARVLLLSDQVPPADADSRIEWRRIERLASRADYSRFMLRGLAAHIATPHALCVQWDGFVINGAAWDPRFLDFDYIGAVWPQFDDGHNVGNGGFSLRSRRLLEASKDLPFDGSQAEDLVIGRLCRRQLEEHGLRFAPSAIAQSFAYERTAPTGCEFGFHGAFNLVHLRPAAELLELFRTLEPGMLARNERLEMMRWALVHGHVRLAIQMLSRLLAAA
jgi:hypothetical protein